MNELIKSGLGVLGRFVLFFLIVFLVAALCLFITGIDDFSSQCKVYWSNPMLMTEELLQNFPVLSEISVINDTMNAIFAVKGAIHESNGQHAVFYDLYFVVLSAIVIQPMIYLYVIFRKIAGKIDGKITAFVCDMINILLISHFGTGIVIVLREYVAKKLFNGNYILAFVIMIVLQLMISSIAAAIGRRREKKKRSFWQMLLDLSGTALVDFLFVALIYACIISASAIFWKNILATELIIGFIVCLVLLLLCIGYKIGFRFVKN